MSTSLLTRFMVAAWILVGVGCGRIGYDLLDPGSRFDVGAGDGALEDAALDLGVDALDPRPDGGDGGTPSADADADPDDARVNDDAGPGDIDGGDGGADAGDGGPDGGPSDATPPPLLYVDPPLEIWWRLPSDPAVALDTQLFSSHSAPLDQHFVEGSVDPQIHVTHQPDPSGTMRVAFAANFAPGVYELELEVSVGGAPIGTIPVLVRVFDEVHLGPDATSCVRPEDAGGSCNFHGVDAIATAHAASGTTPTLFTVYPFADATAYHGGVDLDAPRWIRGAGTGGRADRVWIDCGEHVSSAPYAFRLSVDDQRLEGVMVRVNHGCDVPIDARTSAGITRHHYVHEARIFSPRPDLLTGTGARRPLHLGPESRVQSLFIEGFFSEAIDFRDASASTFDHNTLIYWTQTPAFEVAGTSSVSITNNVVVNLQSESSVLISGAASTTNLEVSGNFVEGFGAIIPASERPQITYWGNASGVTQLESPREPRWLANTTPGSTPVSVAGHDLDGLPFDPTGAIAGAYQTRSTQSGPKRTHTVVSGPNQCDGTCDVIGTDPNAMQKAILMTWPPSQVELRSGPADQYRGSMVLPWGSTISGLGGDPTYHQIVTEPPVDDELPSWMFGPAAIVVPPSNQATVRIEEVMLKVADNLMHGLWIGDEPAGEVRHVERVWIEAPTGPVRDAAVWLGDQTMFRDSYIWGLFTSCVRYGLRGDPNDPTPQTTADFAHLTCRLTPNIPVDFIEMAAARNSRFFNSVFQAERDCTMFRAQLRASENGSTLDQPGPFIAMRLTQWCFDQPFTMFGGFPNTLTSGIIRSATRSPFAGPDDGKVGPLFMMDVGVLLSDYGLPAGFSIDGIDRSVVVPDEGAWEQGN